MVAKYILLGCSIFFAVWGWGCSQADQQKQTYISGTFSVADSIDSSGDYSGIGVTIIKRDSADADADTLYHTVTDTAGNFSGTAFFDEKDRYPMLVTRNNRTLGRLGIILADDDSVRITGALPNLSQTASIKSREHDALDVYQRIDRAYNRVAQYARAGLIKGDSLRDELDKWSDMYWDVYQDNKGTIASEMAASQSVRLLEGWKNEEMMEKVRSLQENDAFVNLALTYGKDYMATSNGLDAALAYLDTLQNVTEDETRKMRIKMEYIELLYDSARVDEAQERLAEFRSDYKDNNEASEWIETISYDLNYLSPGDTVPEFEFSDNGDIVSRDSLIGTPYILEITSLTNSLYQDQFDRTVVIQSIYKNFGLEVITLPLDNSQITIDAFFDERVKAWPVSDAGVFDREELLKRFNIQLIPTRFLVDREGEIVRKYVGREFQDVIQDIQTLINQEKEPAS